MVFARSFKRILSAPKQGEIALTLTVLSLITMLVGTVIGLNRQTPQDVRTSAAVPIEKVQCGGFGCSNNSDCLQTPIKTLCHISTGQCRPMSSKDSCPSVTARVESVKKDVGGSCITKTDCKTGLDCSPGRTCTVLAGGGAGTDGGATGATAIPQPTLQDRTRYRTYPGQCEMLFSNIDDPRIMRITLSTTSGSVVFDTDKEQNGCMGFNSPSKGDSISINYDPRIQQNVIIRSTSSGGLGGTNKTCIFGRQDLSNGVEADPLIVTMYYQVLQGPQGQRVWNSYSQSANTTGGCVGRGNSPTPTKTPTPQITVEWKKLKCGDECTSHSQCPYNINSDPLIVCRTKTGAPAGDKKYCLLAGTNDDPMCKPTGTPTPTKTPTPTPTKTPTPTATPTPPVCRKSVYFMIDNTASQTNNILYLQEELNKFFTAFKSSYVIDYSYQTFNITAPDESGSGSNTINFQFSRDRNWTNIGMAFKEMNKAVADIKIFVSDGVVTVSGDETKSEIICVYAENGNKINGCDPVAKNRDDATNHKTITKCVEKYGTDYYKACRAPNNPGKSNANHAIGALGAGGAGIDTDNMNKSLVNGGKYHPSIDSFIKELPSILANLCPAGGSPVGPARRLSTSFSLQNKSTKTIQKVTVKTCSDQGTECSDFVNPIDVPPQQSKSFFQVIPDSVPVTSRELVTCSVGYSDGSTLPCPRKETQNESVQFNLSATNRAVTGNAQTFLQASDLNGDGRVNVIDFVLLQNQRNVSGAKKYDIILDGVINAQDFAVVTERFGQITQ